MEVRYIKLGMAGHPDSGGWNTASASEIKMTFYSRLNYILTKILQHSQLAANERDYITSKSQSALVRHEI